MSEYIPQLPVFKLGTDGFAEMHLPPENVLSGNGRFGYLDAYCVITSEQVHELRNQIDAFDDFLQKMENEE